MAFKVKKHKNRLLTDERQTLDAKHSNFLQTFQENKSNIPELQKELNDINDKLNKLNDENSKSLVINLKLQQQIWNLDDRKKQLEISRNRGYGAQCQTPSAT